MTGDVGPSHGLGWSAGAWRGRGGASDVSAVYAALVVVVVVVIERCWLAGWLGVCRLSMTGEAWDDAQQASKCRWMPGVCSCGVEESSMSSVVVVVRTADRRGTTSVGGKEDALSREAFSRRGQTLGLEGGADGADNGAGVGGERAAGGQPVGLCCCAEPSGCSWIRGTGGCTVVSCRSRQWERWQIGGDESMMRGERCDG